MKKQNYIYPSEGKSKNDYHWKYTQLQSYLKLTPNSWKGTETMHAHTSTITFVRQFIGCSKFGGHPKNPNTSDMNLRKKKYNSTISRITPKYFFEELRFENGGIDTFYLFRQSHGRLKLISFS